MSGDSVSGELPKQRSPLLLQVNFLIFWTIGISYLHAGGDPQPADGLLSGAQRIEAAIEKAAYFLGSPYKLGGMSEKGMDCSGLMVLSFAHAGRELPRTSRDQALQGRRIQRDSLRRGDLIFFKKGSRINHVGMVVENDGSEVWFIHSCVSEGVTMTRLSNSYYAARYHSARRIWEGGGMTAPPSAEGSLEVLHTLTLAEAVPLTHRPFPSDRLWALSLRRLAAEPLPLPALLPDEAPRRLSGKVAGILSR
jgi:hypothetical protein